MADEKDSEIDWESPHVAIVSPQDPRSQCKWKYNPLARMYFL